MNIFYDTLYVYAIEHRVNRFLQHHRAEMSQSQRSIDQAMEQLASMGNKEKSYAEQLQNGMDIQSSIHSEATFLAGLSMGLELGRLGHGV